MLTLVHIKNNYPGCPAPEITELENGRFRVTRQLRAGYFLVSDVIEYACDDEFVFHVGKASDYSFECTPDGSWLNPESGSDLQTATMICITGLKVLN